MLNISLLSTISGGLTITFVSANQRWGSFSTVGVRDIAYEKADDKETDMKLELGIEGRKSFLLTGNSSEKYISYQGRLSLVLDFSQYKYLSIKFLLLPQVAAATSWSKWWNFLETLAVPEVLGRGTIL